MASKLECGLRAGVAKSASRAGLKHPWAQAREGSSPSSGTRVIPNGSSDRLPVLARGRDADVFDRGDGTVLRRYRGRDVPEAEVNVMRYARENGYPVPDVIAASGRDLVLERIAGLTMQEAIGSGSLSIPDAAAQLAELHERLHRIDGPEWLRQRGNGDRLVHLDLHPRNVLLGPKGPVVIDWANAA